MTALLESINQIKFVLLQLRTALLNITVLFMYSPTSDGSAAALICSEAFVRRHGLEPQAVEIVAQEMKTDFPSTFADNSCIKMVSFIYVSKVI